MIDRFVVFFWNAIGEICFISAILFYFELFGFKTEHPLMLLCIMGVNCKILSYVLDKDLKAKKGE